MKGKQTERKQRISAPPITKELRLDELMRNAGISSMKELANRMGIERTSLSRALNGSPTYGILYNLAEALGVRVQDLFVPSEKPQHTMYGVIVLDDKSYVIHSYNDMQNALKDIEKAIQM